jgi:hypothetical protein
VTIPRFIQIDMHLPPLKPMAQSQRGVIGVRRIMEVEVRPLIVVIPRFIGVTIIRGCTCASIIRTTPRYDGPIGFKGGKGAKI